MHLNQCIIVILSQNKWECWILRTCFVADEKHLIFLTSVQWHQFCWRFICVCCFQCFKLSKSKWSFLIVEISSLSCSEIYIDADSQLDLDRFLIVVEFWEIEDLLLFVICFLSWLILKGWLIVWVSESMNSLEITFQILNIYFFLKVFQKCIVSAEHAV